MKNARELIDSFNRILVDLAFGGTENEETLAYMKEVEETLTKEGYTQKPVWFLRNAEYKKVSQFKKRKVSYKASFVCTSVRPADHKEKGFPKGDCSTRAMSYVLGKDYKEDGRVYLIPYVPLSKDNVSYLFLCVLKPSSDFPFLFTNDSDCIKHSDNIDEKKDD